MNESVKEVTDNSFEHEVLKSDKPVLVDFWAAWCAPCRILSPTVEAIAEQYSGSLAVVKLNVDDNPSTASLPEYCSAIASTVGDNIRQGAHQAAQKSTSTGLSDFRTSCSKELSVTSLTLSFIFVVPSYFACLLEMLENFYA